MRKSLTCMMLGLICLGLVFTGCPTDSEADTTNPVAGASGVIKITAVSSTTANLAWTAATDEGESKLFYKVVSAASLLDIDTAEEIDVITGSGIIQDWTADISTVSLNSLSPETTYYVNVAVKDESDNLTAYIPSVVITLQDTESPVAGSNGAITVSVVTQTSADLTWTAASDDGASELLYKVVSASTAEAIDTTGEIVALTGSGVIKDWTSEINSASLSSLTPKTTYYVNVTVKDSSNNLTAYTPVEVTTHPDKLFLFFADRVNGNMGGRTGANNIIATSLEIPTGVTVTVAFLSVSEDDQLCDIPENYGFPTTVPIYGYDGIGKIADNWADLMDGSIDIDLTIAGVFEASKEDYWWSGSNSDGTVSTMTCNGWEDDSSDSKGIVGHPERTDGTWLNSTNITGVNNRTILGLGY